MSSRIILQNLPEYLKETPDELKKIFYEFGNITDFQLKFKGNKFRKFAFIGYSTPEQAKNALKLDKSFIGTTQIKVSLASDLKNPNIKLSKVSNKKSDLETYKVARLFVCKLHGFPKKISKNQVMEFLKDKINFEDIYDIKLSKPLQDSRVVLINLTNEVACQKVLLKNKSLFKNRFIEIEKLPAKPVNQVRIIEKQKSLTLPIQDLENGRIFLRNLPYICNEDDIENLFSKYGTITEINLPLDKFSKQIKGYGFITFMFPEHAKKAFEELDGTIYMGRMLHLIPAADPKNTLPVLENLDNKSSYKAESLKQKLEADIKENNHFNWNTLFVNPNAIADSISEKYEINKREFYKVGGNSNTRDSAAVKIALAESEIVNEIKNFLVSEGLNLSTFEVQGDTHGKRSKNIILVKNLPANTNVTDLKHVFSRYGQINKLILPPRYGFSALVVYEYPQEARSAFTHLTYVKFNDQPLYLEWAPANCFTCTEGTNSDLKEDKVLKNPKENTLMLRNINPSCNEKNLKKFFNLKYGDNLDIYMPLRNDKSQNTNNNFALITFPTSEQTFRFLEDYKLNPSAFEFENFQIKVSSLDDTKEVADKLSVQPKSESSEQTNTKILVKNIPFQATPQELRDIFGVFGSVKSVRLPLKQLNVHDDIRNRKDNNNIKEHKGFGFVEFLDHKSASLSFKALSASTHLYGRRLVLEWAKTDDQMHQPSPINSKNMMKPNILNREKIKQSMEETRQNRDKNVEQIETCNTEFTEETSTKVGFFNIADKRLEKFSENCKDRKRKRRS